jgi:sugar lactone lactonase YvrE
VVPAGYVFVLEWTESTEGTAHKRIVKLSPDGISLSTWTSEGESSGKFNQPYGISLHEENGATCIYVSDTFNNRIQKFSSEGEWMQTWGAPEWSFNYPEGIAIDAAGSIYVADENNHLVRKINPDGSSATWSLGGTYYPYSVAVEAGGLNIYAAAREGMLFYRILKVNAETGDVAVWGSGFNQPHGVAIGPDGYVYVADTGNNLIKKCTPDGSCTTCATGLTQPLGVAIDAALNIYVADTGNDWIKIYDQNGSELTILGRPGNMPGQLSFPTNLAVGPDGRIYVSDTGNNRIQVFNKLETLQYPKAIIIAGGGPYPGNNLWDATQATANFAYRTFIYRGFTDDDIYYLSSNTDLDLDNDGEREVDNLPTIANLQYAMTEWALDQDAGSLIVYLTDHGGAETFRLH